MNRLLSVIACSLSAALATSASATVAMDYVRVGNPNNTTDPATSYGAVDHSYWIGKYEVTNAQYAEFLNAKGQSNANEIYNSSMASYGITQSGSSGSYNYTVTSALANRPVVFVSWFDAARFANWMSNGQGNGDMETGAYTLNGATDGIITANAGAKVYIPSEDEWYKAAYYNATNATYSLYPNGQNTITTADANYNSSVSTNVGNYSGDASSYGTYDQGGNVWEWNDAVFGSSRGLRGGAWNNGGYGGLLHSSGRDSSRGPSYENNDIGFRLAAASIDTDSDGIDDFAETNTGIYISATNTGTNPNSADTDGDLFGDGFEVSRSSNPILFSLKPANMLIMQKVVDTNNLGIGGCFGLSASNDLLASQERVGNGRVHLCRVGASGEINKLFSIDSPHQSYDHPGFGLGISLCGDQLMVGNPVTAIHATHDGCAYMYSIGVEGPVLKETYDTSPRTAGYLGASVQTTGKNRFALASGHEWYNSASRIHYWSKESAMETSTLIQTLELPHYVGGFVSGSQGDLLTLFREYGGVKTIIQFGKGIDSKFTELRSGVVALKESYTSWEQKRIAEYRGTVYVTDKSRLAWFVPTGNGFSEHFLELSAISPGAVFDAQSILIKDDHLFVSSVSSIVRPGSSGVVLAFDLKGSLGIPVFREAIAVSDEVSGGNLGISLATTDIHKQFIAVAGNSDKMIVFKLESRSILNTTLALNGAITGAGEYDPGTSATLTAVPDAGYAFTGWTGDASGTTNPLSLTMDASKTVSATFAADLSDTDLDGLSAYDELVVHGTDPALADTDGDGLSDALELGIGRFSIVSGSFTWQQARTDARSKGGDLAAFPTEALWNRALQHLGANPFDEFTGLWIGASDAAVEGTWRWVNGEAFSFAPWGTSRPSSTVGNTLDFAEISGGNGSEIGKWYDRSATAVRDGYLLETGYATDPTVADADGDGLNDGQEQTAGSHPAIADTDGDGLSDGQEVNLTRTNPTLADTDSNGLNDAASDEDGDGLSNLAEISTHGTDPLKTDTDGDGLSDSAELSHPASFFALIEGSFTHAQATGDASVRRGRLASFPNANDFVRMASKARKTSQGYLWLGLSDAAAEGTWTWTDGSSPTYTRWLNDQPDGATAENHVVLMENSSQWADAEAEFIGAGYLFERVGLDPLVADTDGDGLNDGVELSTHQTSPVLDDSDGDGLSDGAEITIHGSNPNLDDSDADGLSDSAEVVTHGTNPSVKDSDSDGFDDLFEINTGFNPTQAGSTPDAQSGIQTAVKFWFNAGNGLRYRIESSTDLQTWTTVENDIIGTGGMVTRFYDIENQPKRYFRVRRN